MPLTWPASDETGAVNSHSRVAGQNAFNILSELPRGQQPCLPRLIQHAARCSLFLPGLLPAGRSSCRTPIMSKIRTNPFCQRPDTRRTAGGLTAHSQLLPMSVDSTTFLSRPITEHRIAERLAAEPIAASRRSCSPQLPGEESRGVDTSGPIHLSWIFPIL